MKLYYYGPVQTQEIIRTAIVNTFNDPDFEQQIHKYTVTTDPADVSSTGTYRFLETFDEGPIF
jgi:hypothetical protein